MVLYPRYKYSMVIYEEECDYFPSDLFLTGCMAVV